MTPEHHNAVKVLLFLDVGDSMDDHAQICEELFSATRREFKHVEYLYIPQFSLWAGVAPQHSPPHRHYPHHPYPVHPMAAAYRVTLVGDATMSPYEIIYPGGSVEHSNPELSRSGCSACYRFFPRSSGSTRNRKPGGSSYHPSA